MCLDPGIEDKRLLEERQGGESRRTQCGTFSSPQNKDSRKLMAKAGGKRVDSGLCSRKLQALLARMLDYAILQ